MISKGRQAFTYVEVVVVIGIFAILVALAVPFTISSLVENYLANAGYDTTSALFTQQQNAFAGKDGQGYGVKFEVGRDYYEMYTGADYAGAVSVQQINFTSGVTISDFTGPVSGEVHFSSGSFRPDYSAGVTQITLERSGFETIVEINTEGLISFFEL